DLFNYLSLEIVIISSGDAYVYKFTNWNLFPGMNNYFVVHFHAVKFGAPDITASFLFVDQNLERFSQLFQVLFIGNLLLDLHDLLGSSFFFFLRSIII